MILSDVSYTKAGLLVREDTHLGFIVFSTHTGLVFACQATDGEALLKWLNHKSHIAPSPEYEKALGPDGQYPCAKQITLQNIFCQVLNLDGRYFIQITQS